MKKVFIETPMEINNYVTAEVVNTYIRKAAGAAKAIIDEDIEVETNFFLEPIGTDKDGEPIMQVRNFDDEIKYMAEELSLIDKCDYIVIPRSDAGVWSCARVMFRDYRIYLNGRILLDLPIQIIDNENNGPCCEPVRRPRSRYNY